MSNKWKEVFILLSGYLSIVAFAIVGGYAIVKNENESLKKSAKTTLIITLIFTAISAFLNIFNAIGSLCNGYLISGAHDFYTITTRIVIIAKVIVFATFIIITLVRKKTEK